ncbi:MAG: hypothetical protein [Chaetfec virus UA24_144]|nr:MAG: hypothetical protein [Chaetfec virus UA24_144]
MDLQQIAMGLIQKNPQIAGNPQAKEFIGVIQSGDAARGEQIANNILKSYGMTKEDALQQAKNFFGLPI